MYHNGSGDGYCPHISRHSCDVPTTINQVLRLFPPTKHRHDEQGGRFFPKWQRDDERCGTGPSLNSTCTTNKAPRFFAQLHRRDEQDATVLPLHKTPGQLTRYYGSSLDNTGTQGESPSSPASSQCKPPCLQVVEASPFPCLQLNKRKIPVAFKLSNQARLRPGCQISAPYLQVVDETVQADHELVNKVRRRLSPQPVVLPLQSWPIHRPNHAFQSPQRVRHHTK